MGQQGTNPYTSPTLHTNYNTSPPPDDGTQVAANLAQWADVKTKLADVLKTTDENLDTNISAAFGAVLSLADDVRNQMTGSLAFGPSELTIASGAITPTRSLHTVDTESDAGTDDLDSMASSSVYTGAIVILRAANTARTVVCKHQTGGAGSGQLNNIDNVDFSLDDSDKVIAYELRADSDWYEIFRSAVRDLSGRVLQQVYAEDTTYSNNAGTIPVDNSIPQNSEGVELITVAITPSDTANTLVIEGLVHAARGSAADAVTAALFQDATANALESAVSLHDGASTAGTVVGQTYVHHRMTAGTTSSTTFKLRAGSDAGTTYYNGNSSARYQGGVLKTWIKVTEYAA